jgi:CDGSH-type Zn-finger protein
MPTKVTIRNNKSILVEGEFELVDETGAPFDLAGRTKISLCRCGHSADKPFCDGSHNQANFQSQVKARALPPPAPKP